MQYGRRKIKKYVTAQRPSFSDPSSRCFLSMSELYNYLIDVDDGYPGFHIAAYEGNTSFFAEHVLKDKDNVESNINRQIRPLGVTPLRLAIGRGHLECASFLIRSGAIVDLTDSRAQTPLYLAVRNHDAEAVHLLLEAGANPNGDLNNLATPLYIAARDKFTEGLKLLLQYGASFEACEASKISIPLHVAATYKHYDCYILLLKAGADPNQMADRPHYTSSQFPLAYLPHCAVTRNLNTKFLEAYVEFGGHLLKPDISLRRNSLLNLLPGCPSKECLLQCIGKPLTLKSHCRLAARQLLGKQRLSLITNLPLPSIIIDYLKYSEFPETEEETNHD